MSGFDVAEGVRGFVQRVRPINNRREPSGLDELLQNIQILVVCDRKISPQFWCTNGDNTIGLSSRTSMSMPCAPGAAVQDERSVRVSARRHPDNERLSTLSNMTSYRLLPRVKSSVVQSMTWSAPSERTISTFLVLHTRVTFAPDDLAI